MNLMRRTVKGLLLLAGALSPAIVVNLVESDLLSGSTHGPGPSSFFEVKRGPMGVRIEMKGTISPKNAVRLSPGIQRAVKVIYKIPEGTPVKKGDILVRLEIPGINEDIQKAEQDLATHINRYDNLLVEYEIIKDETEIKVDKARIDYDEAVMGKKKYEEYEAPLDHKRLLVGIDQAEMRLGRARKRAVRLKAYQGEGFSTRDELIEGELEVKRAEQALEKAKAGLDLYVRFTRPMNVARRANGLKSAGSAFSAAKKLQDVKRKGLELGLVQQKRSVLRVRRRRDQLHEYRKKTVLKAPVEGVAIHGAIQERRNYFVHVSGRGNIWGENTIISIPASREVIVGIRVPEEKIYLIEKGMKALVRMDSAGLAMIEGVVGKVAELPSEGDWRMGTKIKEFAVEISIDAGGRFLRPNSNVQVEIEVAHMEDVLFVPAHVVKKEKGRDFCWVLEGGELVRTEVEVGSTGEAFKEIVSGLAEGDKVFLGTPEAYSFRAEVD